MGLSRRWGWTMAALPLAAVVALAAWGAGWAGLPRETGYLSPLFAPDGQSVLVVRRDVAALVTGFGREFFTLPATVRIRRDRLTILGIRLADGRLTELETLPPSPLEGMTIEAYHHAIFGEAHAHLRWADAAHLDYEIAVTHSRTPSARTFVTRKIWNPQTKTTAFTGPWAEGSTGMGGDEPQQLAGDLEVIAVPGDEGMACAIVVMGRHDHAGRAIVETRTCRGKYPSGYTATVLAPFSRRADIERSELIRRTYADLVERGRRAGLPEGRAMLDADDEMSRRGLYPKPTTITAQPADCAASSPLFDIADEQFAVGLFPDIDRAIASPGQPANKSMGAYITHRDYTTSQRINDYLTAGHTSFFVRAHGACWRLAIDR
jgi:hypothetical protein